MEKNANYNNGGIGFFGMLTILFIALKLLGKIDWPWYVVLSPIWGCYIVVIIVVIITSVIKHKNS